MRSRSDSQAQLRYAAFGAFFAAVAAGAFLGCSSDATSSSPVELADTGANPVDSIVTDTNEADTGAPNCTGKADGADCGEGNLCLKGVCSPSACGDGFINAASGEECEDGNEVSGDGCSACKFECATDADCDDKNDCTVNTCDKTAGKQMCKQTLAASGATCAIDGGGAGTCKESTCVKAGCGNGVKDTGEECDDGNTDDADGCTKECQFTCKADADCDDGSKCTGAETCDKSNPDKPVCKAGTAVVCAKKGSCAAVGACDPTSGACVYPDNDKDGVSCDSDCNDADPVMYPGAAECKDGKDNDCSGKAEDTVDCVCYVDPDKDGYAAVSAATIVASPCPAGYTNRKPVDAKSSDCREHNAFVKPSQTTYFATGYCAGGGIYCPVKTFDYNCDAVESKRWGLVSKAPACTPLVTPYGTLCSGMGWVGVDVAPGCGIKGNYRDCSFNSTTKSCVGTTSERTQECR